MRVLVKGEGASPGVVRGRVRVALTLQQAAKGVSEHPEDLVLVVPMTTPEWTPYIAVAKAVITDSGGILTHPAIVAREFGIPCVVGTRDATSRLKDGLRVVVDGTAGLVYEG